MQGTRRRGEAIKNLARRRYTVKVIGVALVGKTEDRQKWRGVISPKCPTCHWNYFEKRLTQILSTSDGKEVIIKVRRYYMSIGYAR